MKYRLFLYITAALFTYQSVAAPVNLEATWSTYNQPDATMNLECKKEGTNAYTLIGSQPASRGGIPFSFDLAFGEQVDCRVYATFGDQESPRSEVALFKLPFPALLKPAGVGIRAR